MRQGWILHSIGSLGLLPVGRNEMKKRMFRFRCNGCDLQMVLDEQPEECFCCGSTAIVREGWKQRFSRTSINKTESRGK
jgi:rRNA maturation endonuclease Nob1